MVATEAQRHRKKSMFQLFFVKLLELQDAMSSTAQSTNRKSYFVNRKFILQITQIRLRA